MLGNIFYILGLFILITSFSNLFNYFKFIKIKKWCLAFQRVTKAEITRKDFRTVEDYNIFTMYSIFNFFEIVWFVLGIATPSFDIFLVLIIFELLMKITHKKIRINLLTNSLGFLFNFFKFSVILILILNHFHYHQDLLELFIQGLHKFYNCKVCAFYNIVI